MLFNFQWGQTINSQTANAGSLALPAPEKQIFGHLPASSSIENQTDSDTLFLSCTSLYLPHIFRTSCTSHSVLVHLVHSKIEAFLYTRPFLVVVLQQQHIKNVTNKYYCWKRSL